MVHRPPALILEAVLLFVALVALGEPWRCRTDSNVAVGRPRRGLIPHLEIDRNVAGRVDRLATGAHVGTGDIIQVSYMAAGNRFGVVVSVDGRGGVTLHHPATPHDVPRVRARGETPLPYAFELDDAPGFERFFFVTGPRVSLDPALVVEAAHALVSSGPGAAWADPLPLPAELGQSSFLLRKAR